jgi:hypothetical protein
MHIKCIGQSIIRTPYRDLKLNHILHVPQASKNLASIHRITSDNVIFFELHPNYYFSSRIESHGEHSFKEGLKEDSIPCRMILPPHLQSSKLLVQIKSPSRDGMPA